MAKFYQGNCINTSFSQNFIVANWSRQFVLKAFMMGLFCIGGNVVRSQVVWSGGASCTSAGGTAWLTPGNWCVGAIPSSGKIAQFGGNGTSGTIGFNMNGASDAEKTVGAIEVSNTNSIDRTINNSSGTAGIMTLDGTTINSIPNVIIRNNCSKLLTIKNGGTNSFGIALGNTYDNIINIDSSGGILISSVISGSNKLTKSGVGTGALTLSGANTYSGGTIISSGILRLGASDVLADTGPIILNGGTFSTGATNGFSEIVGTITLTENSTIALGTGDHTLTFANSSAIPWVSNKQLTVKGWKGIDGSSGTAGKLVIGAGGLTPEQLSQITFEGYSSGAMIVAGEIVPYLATEYFRSNVTSGNWSSPSSWQSSDDNSTWVTAKSTPGNFSRGVTIRNGQIITLTSNTSTKLLTIEAGGTLTNTSGYQLTIEDDGTPASDFNIYGTYILFGTTPKFNNGATATVHNNGVVRADDNVGLKSDVFASSNSVLFKTGAIFDWNNATPFTCGITYFPNSTTDIPFFRVSKPLTTGAGVGSATTFNGILEVNADMTFAGGGAKNCRDGIKGTATLTQEDKSGDFFLQNTNAILGGPALKIILASLFRLSPATIVPSGANVTISGANIDNNKTGNVYTINGILDVTTINITNTNGSVVINGTYRTAHPGGFSGSGSSIVSGSVTLNPNSTIEFYALGNQPVIEGPDYSNIILSGSGTKTPSSAFSPKGTITIKDNAVFDCTSKNIGDVNTNLTMRDNGRLIVSTTGTNPSMGGVYDLTGGVVEFANKNVTAQTIRSSDSKAASILYNNIEITGNNVGNSNGYIYLSPNGIFTVKSGGVFTINTNSIKAVDLTSGQKVTVESGGTIRAGNNGGFNGADGTGSVFSAIHSNITNITLQPGSTVEYTRPSDQPITNANGLVYQNLVISGTGNKTAPSGNLIIKGDFTKTGTSTFIHNNGTVVFNGDTAQNFSSSSAQTVVFNNLTNNNTMGLNIKNNLAVYKELLLGDQSKITLDGDITLQSNSSNTANVSAIPAKALITYQAGRFIIERYIPMHSKAWQFVAAPAKGSSVNAAWQEGNMPEKNSKPGYGVQITSPYGTDSGFDLKSSGHSMKYYDPAADAWVGITSTANEISNPNGYMLFVRGDRSVDGVKNINPTATTLRTRGKLYAPGAEAPVSVNVPANSFQSVANPYASAVDFQKILAISSGINVNYYVWDPQLTTYPSAYGYGAYRTISGNTVVPSGDGNYPTDNAPPIQSGQAFFVRSDAGGKVNFDESVKITGSRTVFKPAGTFSEPAAQLRGNLYVVNGSEPVLVDGILTQFDDSYSNELDAWDALKISNSGENMAIISNGKKLAIERRKITGANDTLFYNLGQMQQRNYQFEFIGTRLDQYGMEAFLNDNYLHTQTPLNLTGTTLVPFSVNSSPASWAANRFNIVFSAAAGPLPVTFASVKAYQLNTHIVVEWKVENESNIKNYAVEKSADGNRFVAVNTQAAINAPGSGYNWIDINPYDGYNYYRIKSTGINGEIKWSSVVRIYTGKGKPSVSVYPNPLVGGIINLQLVNQPAGNYHIRLLNLSGQLLLSKELNHAGGSSSQPVILNQYEPHGVYHLEISGPNGEKNVLKIKN